MFAWIAISFAILSVPGALIFIPGLDVGLLQLLGNALSPVTAVLSWASALTATIISLVNVIRRRSNRRVRLALWLAVPGAVLGTAALVAVFVIIGNALGLWAGNAAETAARPAVDAYTNSGAKLICKNGDGGFGPDNRIPWFDAYLDVPKSLATTERATAALKAAEFDAPSLKAVDPGYGDAPPAGSFALASGSGDHHTSVQVYPSGSAPLYCTENGIDKYGKPYTPKAGRALVEVQVSLPSRK
ncbi:MAG TPA: hypothetical protein VK537_05970 [Galbitalea sp.]|nr:hypothetical protein [Galbitalea sp.]